MERLKYNPTADEMRRGSLLLHINPAATTPQAQRRGLIGWLLFLGMAVIVFVMLRNNAVRMPPTPAPPAAPTNNEPAPWILWTGLTALGAGSLLFVLGFRTIRNVHVGMAITSRDDVSLRIGDDGLAVERPDHVDRYNWSGFRGVVETDEFIVLRIRHLEGLVLPKRLFDAASLQRLLELLRMHVVPRVPSLQQGFDVQVRA